MSEEEKKAIEHIKLFLKIRRNEHSRTINKFKKFEECYGLYNNGNIQILLNLIEKKQKEIENLKKQVKNKDLEAQRYFDITIYQALQFDKEIQELKKDIDNNRKLFKELKEE